MTEQELLEQRRHQWRLDGRAMRTPEEAREFLESVGFCLMYPLTPQQARDGGLSGPGAGKGFLAPTFIGAYVGCEERLPTWQHAFADPRAKDATDLMVHLLRERAAYEANLFGESNLLVAASLFPFVYAVVGDRNPRQAPKAGARSGYSPLAHDVFEAVRKDGPISKKHLREVLGGDPSGAALDRALGELWSRLRITRVDYQPKDGASWDVLYRWSPQPVREGINLSVGEALSAMLSKYLEAVVAADPAEIEQFFAQFVPRSRVKEAVNALLATREFSFVHVGKRPLIQVTPARTVPAPRPERKAAEVRTGQKT